MSKKNGQNAAVRRRTFAEYRINMKQAGLPVYSEVSLDHHPFYVVRKGTHTKLQHNNLVRAGRCLLAALLVRGLFNNRFFC